MPRGALYDMQRHEQELAITPREKLN